MDKFPVEVLDIIFAYLAESHKPSLKAVSLVTRKFRYTALRYLFHTIWFDIHLENQLREDVNAFPSSLTPYVSHLRIQNWYRPEMEIDHGHIGGVPNRSSNEPRVWNTKQHSVGRYQVAGKFDNFFYCQLDLGLDSSYRSHEGEFWNDESWQPLAELVKQLPSLKDLTYDCDYTPRPCLLQSLRHHRQGCRLHCLCFNFQWEVGPELSIHDQQIITYPYLTTIATNVNMETEGDLYDSNEARNYNQELILDLVRRAAPSLKDVSLQCNDLRSWPCETIPTWRNTELIDDAATRNNNNRSPITRLRYAGDPYLSRSSFRQWCRTIDFSKLEILELGNPFKRDFVSNLCACSLDSLQTLNMTVSIRDAFDWDADEGLRNIAAVNDFLRGLRPLTNIQLKGAVAESHVTAVLLSHGSTLKRLSIVQTNNDVWSEPGPQPCFDAANLTALSQSCPLLEELTIRTRRSEGDANETQIYQALGSFVHLRSIFLVLDASSLQPLSITKVADDANEMFGFDSGLFELPDAVPSEIRKGEVRHALINCALDAKLAQEIFHVIAAAKANRRARPLEVLKVTMENACQFKSADGHMETPEELEDLANELSRAWFVERGPRDDYPEALETTELYTRLTDSKRKRTALWPPARAVFRKNWPHKTEGSRGWWDDWHSFPLQAS